MALLENIMSENQNIETTKPAEGLGRRLFIFKAATVVGAAAAVTAVTAATTTPAQAQYCTDRDSFNPVGGGRWCRRRRRYCTDRDPYNPVGGGRWCR